MNNPMAKEGFAHWRRIRVDLEHEVLLRVARTPALQARNWILAFNASCGSVLESFIFNDDDNFAPFRQNIATVTTQDLKHVYAAFYLAFMSLQKHRHEVAQWEGMIGVAEVIYSQPKSAVEGWKRFADEISEPAELVSRLPRRLNEEVAPSLGIRQGGVITALGWNPMLNEIMKTTFFLVDDPNFGAMCEKDISRAIQAELPRNSSKSGCVLACLMAAFLTAVSVSSLV